MAMRRVPWRILSTVNFDSFCVHENGTAKKCRTAACTCLGPPLTLSEIGSASANSNRVYTAAVYLCRPQLPNRPSGLVSKLNVSEIALMAGCMVTYRSQDWCISDPVHVHVISRAGSRLVLQLQLEPDTCSRRGRRQWVWQRSQGDST
jgi:hypothetical protein